jgi:recombination protein RecA
VRRIASLKKGDVHIGNRVAVKVVKNKVAAPFKRVELDLLFEEGISKELDLLDAAMFYEIIEQHGSWFSLDGVKFANGRDQALQFLKKDAQFADKLFARIKEKLVVAV